VLHPYKIASWTTIKYIVYVFWKKAPYMKTISPVSVAIWVTVFILTMLICSPHLSLKLTCTPSIHKLLTGPSIKLYILTVAFMLNFLWLFVKWIKWYFLKANTILCWCAHAIYTLYAIFRALQFFSVILLYVNILELLMNPTTVVVPLCSSSRNVQAKKRNKIGNSTKP